MNYPVVEKFVSVNGEGLKAGELAVFIRFFGCNLTCSYCDTAWANEPSAAFDSLSEDRLYAYIKSTGIIHVTLTGGEPLLVPNMAELLAFLCKDPVLRIEIETNGSVDISPFLFISSNQPTFTMDYKLMGSGMESHMRVQNFQYLTGKDTVKFVAESIEDMERAVSLIQQYDLTTRCNVHFSPVFEKLQLSSMVTFMIEHQLNKVRLAPQLHKIIWHPDTRGV